MQLGLKCLKQLGKLLLITLLVPGVGAQGGNLEEVAKNGMNKECGLLINSSRAIIYADSTENFAEVAKEQARKLQEEMKIYLDSFGI